MIGVGLLGSGFIAETYADALTDVRNAELVACYSRNSSALRGLRQEMERQGLSRTMDEVCADPRVEIVVIALPNEVHLEAVRDRRATRQGDHLHQAPRPHRGRGAEDPRHR